LVSGLLGMAVALLSGCQASRYSSLLEAQQACEVWARVTNGKSKLTYPKDATNDEIEHINNLHHPRHCEVETLTRQVIGLEYEGKMGADPLLSHKASAHYRY